MEILEFKIIISEIKNSLNRLKNEESEKVVSETEHGSTKNYSTWSRKSTGNKE